MKQLYTSFSKKLFFVITALAMVMATNIEAQCIGPYQVYESCKVKASMITDNWVFGTTASNISTLVANARSGTSAVVFTAANAYFQTPLIASPDNFSFYYRNTGTAIPPTITFKVEWSTDPIQFR